MNDVDLLARFVHHGLLSKEEARGLVPELQGGAVLDDLLVERLGWDPDVVAARRRTGGDVPPEIPGYALERRLGTGGTADVWLARERKTHRALALKVLKPEATLHEPTRKAFIAEARLLEKLACPGLVKGFGIARSGNTFFSRLEHVDGSTLLELLDGGKRFTEEEALSIVLSVAETLKDLEQHGVVHRDVKPGNVMCARDGRVILIDLGFAAGEGERAQADGAVGTVAYLSPEQARGGAAADSRSDIYSLGISLFHVVVGKLPFEGSDDREVLRRQVMESLSSPELKGRGISPHLHYFIEKMVAKEAGDRYQGWAELIADVRQQLAGREGLDFSVPQTPHGPRGPRRGR